MAGMAFVGSGPRNERAYVKLFAASRGPPDVEMNDLSLIALRLLIQFALQL